MYSLRILGCDFDIFIAGTESIAFRVPDVQNRIISGPIILHRRQIGRSTESAEIIEEAGHYFGDRADFC